MQVLVTGVRGELGSKVATALQSQGHAVRGADFIQANIPGVECIAANMADYQTCISLGEGMDVIAYLGAYHGIHLERPNNPNAKTEIEFFDANISGTFNMLRSAVENHVSKVVWASSTVVFERYWSAYGIYSLTKRTGEMMCQYFHDAHNLRIIGLRYGGFVPIDFVSRGFGMLETWIEPDEVVKATVAAIDKDTVDFGFYDVQTPLPFTEEDVASYLAGNKLAVLTKYWSQHTRLLEQYVDWLPDQVYQSDINKTQDDLGFQIEKDFGWFLDELSQGRQ